MDRIIYCYIDKKANVHVSKSNNEELAYSKLQQNVCYYDEGSDEFLNRDGNQFSITGKRVLMRTQIKYINMLLQAIERKGGIPINSRQDIDRILNWKREIPTERSYLLVKGRDILESEEVKKQIVELANHDQFFFKTVKKDFSGTIAVEELFDPSKGFLSALELHRETNFIVSEKVDILKDTYGNLEYRCFVVDGKILNISRMLLSTYHNVDAKIVERANYLLNRIQEIKNFPTTFSMDIMVAVHPNSANLCIYDIVELNPIEATGEYLYNTVWENSIQYNDSIEDAIVPLNQSTMLQMKNLVPVYKRTKNIGFEKRFEPKDTMEQCYYLNGFSYHYGCAKKFGNPLMNRFWIHNLYPNGFGEGIDIIEILNGNISLKKALSTLRSELKYYGANIEYMEQKIASEEQQKLKKLEIEKISE